MFSASGAMSGGGLAEASVTATSGSFVPHERHSSDITSSAA
jgi:hypothetical protein